MQKSKYFLKIKKCKKKFNVCIHPTAGCTNYPASIFNLLADDFLFSFFCPNVNDGECSSQLPHDGGMAPYNSKNCKEVFGTACTNCQGASTTVIALLAVAIATVIPAMCLDIHRVFVFFDYNLSKIMALTLHLVFGVIFTVLAYMTFLQKCFYQG